MDRDPKDGLIYLSGCDVYFKFIFFSNIMSVKIKKNHAFLICKLLF